MLKEMVRSLAHFSGYEIMTLGRAWGDRRCIAALLEEQKINVVVDVGANLGQFAQWIRKTGFAGQIISFEPLSEAHTKLGQIAERDSHWTVAPRMALGSFSGRIAIHVAGNSASSSILPMLVAHESAVPHAAYIDTETVILNRLDDVYPLSQQDRILLKVDVQGYEKAVLEGASRALGACRVIVIELSLVPLYEGQPLAVEMWEHLISLGFHACYFIPGFRDPQSGRMLQMDGVFVRE